MSPFLLGVSLSSLDRVLGRTLVCTHGEASGFFCVCIIGLPLCTFCFAIEKTNNNQEVSLWESSKSNAPHAINIILLMCRSLDKKLNVLFVETVLHSGLETLSVGTPHSNHFLRSRKSPKKKASLRSIILTIKLPLNMQKKCLLRTRLGNLLMKCHRIRVVLSNKWFTFKFHLKKKIEAFM